MTIEGKEKFVRDEAIKKDGGGAIETNTILDKVGSETPDWLVNIEAKIGEMNTGYQEQFNADVEKIFRTFLSTQTEKFSGTDIMQQIETKFKAWAEANKNKKIPGLQFNETDLLSYISECVSLEVNKEQEINALIKTTEQEINTLIEDTKQKVENIKEEILKESDIRGKFTLFSGVTRTQVVEAVNAISNPQKKSLAISFLKSPNVKEFQKQVLNMSEGTGANQADGKFGRNTLIALQGLQHEVYIPVVEEQALFPQTSENGDVTDGNETPSSTGSGSSVNYPINGSGVTDNSAITTSEITSSNSGGTGSNSGEKKEFVTDKHEDIKYADIDKLPEREKQLLKKLIGRRGEIDGIYDENNKSFESLKKSERRELNKLVRVLGKVNFIPAMDFLTHCWYDKENIKRDNRDIFSKSVVERFKDSKYDYNPGYKDKKLALQDLAGFFYDFVTTPKENRQPIHRVMGVLVAGGATGNRIDNIIKNQHAVNTVLKGKESSEGENAFMSPVEKSIIGMVSDANLDGTVSAYLGKLTKDRWKNLLKEKRKEEKADGNSRKEYNKQAKEEEKLVDRDSKKIDVAGNVSGAQIFSAYESAKEIIAVREPNEKKQEKILVQNLLNLIENQSEKIYKSNQDGAVLDLKLFREEYNFEEITTFKDFSELLQKEQYLMMILKGAINFAHEHLTEAFAYGPEWVNHHLDKNRKKEPEAKLSVDNVSIREAHRMNQLDTIKISEDMERAIEDKIDKEYVKYLKQLQKEIADQKKDLEDAIKKESDPARKAELQKELDVLNSNEFKKSLEYLTSEEGRNAQKKKLRVDFVGLLYQHFVLADDSTKQSLGIGMNVTHEGFNDWLRKNIRIFDKFSFSAGIGVGKQGDLYSGMIGLAATFSGAKGLWKGGTLIYAAGCGVGYDTRTKFNVGPFGAIGLDQRIFNGAKKGRIDANAAHYLGAIVNGSLVGWGLSIYWRRDKLEGLKNQAEKLDVGYTDLIKKLVDPKEFTEQFSLDTIHKKLKDVFPKEKSNLLPFAHDVYAGLAPYAELFKSPKEEDKKALEEVINQLAQNFTNHWLNQNTKKLNDQRFHLSGISLGAQFVAGWWPMPTFGIMFTKYRNLRYEEQQTSIQRSREILQKGYGVDKIDGANFGDFARNLDVILQKRYDNKKIESEEEMIDPKYFEYDELKSIVKIDKSVMEKMNIHILPELQQFLAKEGNKIIVPAQLPVTYVNEIRANKTTRHLIIGSVGLENTDFISSFDKIPVYNEDAYIQQMSKLDTLPALSEHAGELRTDKIDKTYLENKHKKTLFEGRLKASFDKELLDNIKKYVDISKLKISNIGEEKFTLDLPTSVGHILVNNQGTPITSIEIPYTSLGTLRFASRSDAILQLDLIPSNDEIPLLKVEYGEIEEKDVVREIAFGEALKDQVDEKVLEHFRSWKASEFLVAFRNKHYAAYYEHVRVENYIGAATLLSDFMTSYGKNYSDFLGNFSGSTGTKLKGNINFVYAAMSRVLKTEYKQFGKDFENEKSELVQEMERLVALTGLSNANKTELITLATERINKGTISTNSFARISQLLGLTASSVNQQPTHAKDKLFWMLADLKTVVDSRGEAFMSRLKHAGELQGKTNALKEIENARNVQKEKLNFPFDNAVEYGSTLEKGGGYTGLVFAYGKNTGHYKKFINSPLVIKDAIEPLNDPATKRYFLENLARFQSDSNVLAKTVQQIKAKLPNSGITVQHLIDALCGNGKLNVAGKEYPITTDFSFAFFADCVNESILMSPIKVEGLFTEDVYTSGGDSVPVNEYATLNGAVYTNSANTKLGAHVDKITVGAVGVVGVEKTEKNNTIIEDKQEGEDTNTNLGDVEDDGGIGDLEGQDGFDDPSTSGDIIPDIPVFEEDPAISGKIPDQTANMVAQTQALLSASDNRSKRRSK